MAGNGKREADRLERLIDEAREERERLEVQLEKFVVPLERASARMTRLVRFADGDDADADDDEDPAQDEEKLAGERWAAEFIADHPELAQAPLVFDDEQLMAALGDAVRRQDKVQRDRGHERLGAVCSGAVADVLLGRRCSFEYYPASRESPQAWEEFHRQWALYRMGPQPTRGDVLRVGRTLGRLARERRVLQYRTHSWYRVQWAPRSMEANVSERLKELARPLATVPEADVLAFLCRYDEPVPFARILAAFLPAGGDVERMKGHLAMRLGRLRGRELARLERAAGWSATGSGRRFAKGGVHA